MYPCAQTKMGTAYVPIHGDVTVAISARGTNELSRGKVFETINENVWMSISEDQRAEFHDADEATEVEGFGIGVATVEDTREVEQFCTLINLRPEPLFESLFGCTKNGGFLDEVQMSEDADDFGEAMGLQDVQKLKGLLRRGGSDIRKTNDRKDTHHLEAIRPIDHKEDEVGDFANVYHGIEFVLALYDREPPLLATDDGDRPSDVVQGLLGVPAH